MQEREQERGREREAIGKRSRKVDHQSSYVSFTRSGQSSNNCLFLLLLPDVSFILSVENATQ